MGISAARQRVYAAGTAALLLILAAPWPSFATSTDDPAPSNGGPVASQLAQHRGLTVVEAQGVLHTQVESAMAIPGLARDAGLDIHDFAIDPNTGKVVAYYTLDSQREALHGRVDNLIRVQHSFPMLAALLQAIGPLAADLGEVFHAASVNMDTDSVVVYGEPALFTHPDWPEISRLGPVRSVVEDANQRPEPTATILSGNYARAVDYTTGYETLCTAGWVTQQNKIVTAGHCTANAVMHLGSSVYNGAAEYVGTTSSSRYQNNGYDQGRINLVAGAGATSGTFANYQGSTWPIYTVIGSFEGAYLCKFGITSGATCGTVNDAYTYVQYGSTKVWDVARTSICTEQHDSGAPVAGLYDRNDNGIEDSGLASHVVSGSAGSTDCGYNTWGASENRRTGYLTNLTPMLLWYAQTLNTIAYCDYYCG